MRSAPTPGPSCPAEDARALANALTERLLDRARTEAEGRAGRAHVEARYDLRQTTAAIANLYLELLQSRPG